MTHQIFSFAISFLAALTSPALAGDRITMEKKIEEIGSTSELDSWPMSDRGSDGYQLRMLAVNSGQVSADFMPALFGQIEVGNCMLKFRRGFLQLGRALPFEEISFDLVDSTVSFDLPLGDDSGMGYAFIEVKVNDPDQKIYSIPLSGITDTAEIFARVREQAFELHPAGQYLFTVNFPKDRPSTVPDLLATIEDYRLQFCASVS